MTGHHQVCRSAIRDDYDPEDHRSYEMVDTTIEAQSGPDVESVPGARSCR
jgi:hypothetical protein